MWTIIIENAAKDFPLTRSLIEKLRPEIVYTDSIEQFLENLKGKEDNVIVAAVKKGQIVKKIDYKIPSRKAEFYIVHSINCVYRCHYCFLQHYFLHSIPIIYVNTEEILKAIENFLTESCRKYKQADNVYFHSAELCDGLVFEHLTGFSEQLIDVFRKFKEFTLEIRTKSIAIHNLMKIKPPENVVISWTMSPQEIIKLYEPGTPSIEDRIIAAEKCQKHGFKIGLRFDPVIIFDGWEEAYFSMLKKIFSKIDVSRIDECVVGLLRCHPALFKLIKEKYPSTKLLSGEFVLGKDGKYKYAYPFRLLVYKFFRKTLEKINSRIKMEVCMEEEDILRRM